LIIDPNRYSFNKVVRILAYVQQFYNNLLSIIRNLTKTSKHTSSESLAEAEKNYCRKVLLRERLLEINHFLIETKYERFTMHLGNLLIYTGRILPEDEVTIVGRFTNSMKYLSQTTFCVPFWIRIYQLHIVLSWMSTGTIPLENTLALKQLDSSWKRSSLLHGDLFIP